MNAEDEVWREAEGRWWVDADGDRLRVDHHPFLLGPSIAGQPTATLGLCRNHSLGLSQTSVDLRGCTFFKLLDQGMRF